MNVLIADDNNTSCKLLRAFLEARGYAVVVAKDGQEALELLEDHPVDAIISDLLMPNLDGYRLCRKIREDNRWRDIPFICYTAIYDARNDEELAFDLGADAYLRKPSSNSTILSALRASIDKGHGRSKRPKTPHTELDVLKTYSQPLVDSLENKYFELSEKNRLADLAVELGLAFTRPNELGEILQSCSQSIVNHLDAALVRIWVLNDRKVALELRGSAATEKIPKGVQLGQRMIGQIVEERRFYQTNTVVNELSTPEQEWARREGLAAFAGYPLIVNNLLVGVMAIFSRKELSDPTVATLRTIAYSIAVGIQAKWDDKVLRESEKRFRQLAESVSEVFWMTDASRREVLFVSPAYEKLWGRSCQSLLEAPDSYFEAIHPDDCAQVLETLQADEASVPYELEYRIVRPDSSVRWIRDRAFPVRDSAGVMIRIARVAEDVTEKREWEIKVRQSQKMQAIGRLAGGIAHDFNNLLSIIFGHSALLAVASPSPQRLRDSVAEINRAAERAAALIQQLLAFGRRQVIEPKLLDLSVLLTESQKLLRRLMGDDVRLKMILSPDLSRVNIDPAQLNQILVNLALNARDAMPEGGELTVEVSDVDLEASPATIYPATEAGRYVSVAVKDTGNGMTPEVQARIFEPFFSTRNDSTGLGLSVVDGIVKQNGGYLSVLSRPELGTTFNVYLPAVKSALNGSSHSKAKAAPGKETILLVEDEDPVREVTALLLESLGYRVLQVCGAEEALDLARKHQSKIDLLLTDVIMPGMNGRELADAFRVHDPEIKVLFQSGHTDDVVVRSGILNAEVAFLQKPFTITTLSKKVREMFTHS